MCYFRVLGFFCKHSVQWDRVNCCPDFLNSSQALECRFRHPIGEISYNHGYLCKECTEEPLVGDTIVVRQPQGVGGGGGAPLLGHGVVGGPNGIQRIGQRKEMETFNGPWGRAVESQMLDGNVNAQRHQISGGSASSHSGRRENRDRGTGDPASGHGGVGGQKENLREKAISNNELQDSEVPRPPISRTLQNPSQRQSQQVPASQTFQSSQLQKGPGNHQNPHQQQYQQSQRPAGQVFRPPQQQQQHLQLAGQNRPQSSQPWQSQNGFGNHQILSQLQLQQLQRSTGQSYHPPQPQQQWQKPPLSQQSPGNYLKPQQPQYPTKRKSNEEQTTPREHISPKQLQQEAPKRRRTGTTSMVVTPRAALLPSSPPTPSHLLPPPPQRNCSSMAPTPMPPLARSQPLPLPLPPPHQQYHPTLPSSFPGPPKPRPGTPSANMAPEDTWDASRTGFSQAMVPQAIYPVQMSNRETFPRPQPTPPIPQAPQAASTNPLVASAPSYFYDPSGPTPYFDYSQSILYTQREAAANQELSHRAILDNLTKIRSGEKILPSLDDPASTELYKRTLAQERVMYRQEMSQGQSRSRNLLKELVKTKNLGNVQFWVGASQALRELEEEQKNQRLKKFEEMRERKQRLVDLQRQQENQIFAELSAGLVDQG